MKSKANANLIAFRQAKLEAQQQAQARRRCWIVHKWGSWTWGQWNGGWGYRRVCRRCGAEATRA